MGRFRYCRDVVAEIRRIDPDSKLTERALREWIASGILPALGSGNRRLIDLDVVLDILKEPHIFSQEKDQFPKIRRIG